MSSRVRRASHNGLEKPGEDESGSGWDRVFMRVFIMGWRDVAAAGLLAAGLVLTARGQNSPAGDQLSTAPYSGWPEGIYLNSPETKVRAVVIPAIGGRIANYSVNGENILYENPGARGKTLASSGDFFPGGYQLDLGPEIRGIPAHDLVWKGPWQWKPSGPYSLALKSDADPALGVRLWKTILFDSDNGDLGINQIVENTTNRETAFCLWDRTLCRNGGIAFFPLNPRSRFPAGWSMRRTVEGKYVYDGTHPVVEQAKVMDGMLFTETRGLATKIGADSDAGWIAYARGDLLFVKYFPVEPKGNYTDGGNTVELYFDQAVVELEPLSGEVALPPGEKSVFPEKWSLIYLEKEVTTIEEARKAARLIPPSPFRR
jgi:hypothetical protein